MNKILSYIGIAVFVFIGITGTFIQSDEYIPNNAKILIIEEYKTWIPDNELVDEAFKEQSKNNPNAQRAYENRIKSTYSEVKNGIYKGYNLPESYLNDKDRILWGKKESLLREWILPKKKRWNEDGSWNW